MFLGDAVSPGPQPNETMALLAEMDGTFIAGNHERAVLDTRSIRDWPVGYRVFMDWIRETLEPEFLDRLGRFQLPGEYTIDERTFVLTHGDESAFVRHVLPAMPEECFRELGFGNSESTILFGHSHVQFHRRIQGQDFINPGSVSLNRCGHTCACYGLLTDGEFTHHSVDYDLRPWLEAVDRIVPLNELLSFRASIKQQLTSGFVAGRVDPWLSLAKAGYR